MNEFSKMTAAIAFWSRIALAAAVLCIGTFAAAQTNAASAAFKVEERNFQKARRGKARLLRQRDAESCGRCGTICTKHNRRKKTSGSVKKQRPAILGFPLSINFSCQQFFP